MWKSYALLFKYASEIITERLEKECSKKGFSVREGWILMAIEEKPLSQHVVAECLLINRNVMVGLVDCLEEKGLVVRKKNPENRRESLLEVTPKGRKILKWIHDGFAERTNRIFHPISSDVRDQCAVYWREIINEYHRQNKS